MNKYVKEFLKKDKLNNLSVPTESFDKDAFDYDYNDVIPIQENDYALSLAESVSQDDPLSDWEDERYNSSKFN